MKILNEMSQSSLISCSQFLNTCSEIMLLCIITSQPPSPLLISAHLPLILFFIVFYSSLTSSYSTEFPSCAQDLSCGNLTNISYPFWLLPDDQTVPSSFCGYQYFNLTCLNNNTPILTLENYSYNVTTIDYEARTISLIDSDVFQSGSCPPVRHNCTWQPDAKFRFISSDNNITFFIDCPEDCAGSRPEHRIKCATKLVPSYVYDGSLPDHPKLYECCKVIAVSPVLVYAVTELAARYLEALQRGFNLSWHEPDVGGQCWSCEKSGGKCGFNNTANTTNYVAVCFCEDRVTDYDCKKEASIAIRKRIITGVLIPLVGSGVILLLFYLLCIRKSKSRNTQCLHENNAKGTHSVETFLNNYEFLGPKKYSYSEVKRMTKSFSSELGRGGYGSVYKGTLSDGHLVAVKVLNEAKGNGEDFMNEVASISRTSHVNIVSLLGYCIERSKRALVYEYMPNGSLEKFIYAKRSEVNVNLGWTKLYEIAVGIARGLEYLHRGCNTRIVHFDIKPHNILLDKDFIPKISDFGLAKLCSRQDSIVSMLAPRGTVGYIAPEVFSRNFGVVSTKSDVYSYGMMVLEMVGGRKNIDGMVENLSEIYFPHWVYDHLDAYVQSEISEVTSETEEIARKMIVVSLWCIQTMPENRPSTNMVISMLEGNLHDLQLPPKP